MIHTKRGVSDWVIYFMIAVTFLGFMMLFLWKNGEKSQYTINQLSSCESGGVGYGMCLHKSACTYVKKEDSTCGKQGDGYICCISMEPWDKETNSGIISQGGDFTDYTFSVGYVGLTSLNDCDGSDTEVTCPAGKSRELEIKVSVQNSGTKKMDISASPVIKEISGKGYMNSGLIGTKKSFDVGANSEVTVSFTFNTDLAKAGRSYKIYPAALCKTETCKNANEGYVYRINNTQFITITFQD